MSDKPHPLPSGGGSYMRAPDGSLERAKPAKPAKSAAGKQAAKAAAGSSTAKKEGS